MSSTINTWATTLYLPPKKRPKLVDSPNARRLRALLLERTVTNGSASCLGLTHHFDEHRTSVLRGSDLTKGS